MPSRIVIIISSIIFLFIVLFFCWHFLISIYEVKYKCNFTSEKLIINEDYLIECVGVNSIGWEIGYRNLYCDFEILAGSEHIKINKGIKRNSFSFSALSNGELTIIVNSRYSLNPTYYKLQIVER